MKIAVIGGIGSGKSTALKIFNKHKYKTYEADEINRTILERQNVQARLKQEFPEAFIDGVLNKLKLRDCIFNSKEAHNKATDIITQETKNEILKILKANTDDLVLEMPLIDQTILAQLDYIICIEASEELRLKFLQARGIDSDIAKKIMSFQPTSDEYKTNANQVIYNTGDTKALENKIEEFILSITGNR